MRQETFVIPLSRLKLSGVYRAILIGKWIFAIVDVTYAQYSYRKFWWKIDGYSHSIERKR